MKSKAKKIISIFFLSILALPIFAEITARQAVEKASKLTSSQEVVDYLKSAISTVRAPEEKRALYSVLASVQEQLLLFSDACASYVAAAGISVSAESSLSSSASPNGASVFSIQNKTSPTLVLDAVRCSLSIGDFDTANNYLNSAVRNSKDEKIQAKIKLYEIWSSLCKITDEKDLEEPLALLKTYTSLPSMKSVLPSLFLTLWYLTGDAQYANNLKTSYPGSPESAIVQGKVQLMPSPFWFFVPRKGDAIEDANLADKSSMKGNTLSAPLENSKKSVDVGEKENRVAKQQLGLFRNKSNADDLVLSLTKKGFDAHITEEKRASGTTYFIVVVDEDKDGTMGIKLRSAGFECYPVFE